MNTKNYGAEPEKSHAPELIGDYFKCLLKKSCEQPFSGIRQQLASGHLPNLAQNLGSMVTKAGKEVLS